MISKKFILLILIFFSLYANDSSYFEDSKANLGKPNSEAAKFYAKACLENKPTACDMLSAMISRTKYGKRDYSEIAKHYGRACEGGEVIGCSMLAGMYIEGKKIEQNISKGIELYMKACEGREETGCNVLGMMYANGKTIEQNYTKSIEFFKQSCDNGSILGCKSLGSMYKKGRGVEENSVKADELFEKAYILDIYGNMYNQLTESQKEYLDANYKLIRHITKAVLDRYGSSRIPSDLVVNESNIIEFNLYPNGSISDISFIQKSKIDILNDTTRETIEIAYYKYPRPKEKILIRYRINYDLDKNNTKKGK